MPARGKLKRLDAQSTPPGSDCAPVHCGQRTETHEASRAQPASPLFSEDLSGLIHGFINMAPLNRASHDASCEMAAVLRGALGG